MTGSTPQPGETQLPETSPGGGPWASDGPEGAWWRGDPAARVARLHPIEPIPTVTLTPPAPTAPDQPTPPAEAEPPAPPKPASGPHTLPETLPEPEPAGGAAPPEPTAGDAARTRAQGVEAGPNAGEPETAASEPPVAVAEPEPAVEEPTATEPEPGATEPEPTAEEPTATEPEPATAEPEPDAAETQPGAETQPVTETQPPTETEPAAEFATAEEQRATVEAAQIEPASAAVVTVTRPIPQPDGGEDGWQARKTVRIAVPERVPAPEPDERPFWMPVQEVPRGRGMPPVRGAGRPPKPPRRPVAGLFALLVLALVATFFAWVSAEPLWLAVGHGERGTATVTECTGDGVSQRCLGDFAAEGGAFTAERVRLVGVGDRDEVGTTVAARMVTPDSGRAYADAASGVLHLRWGLGMGLVVLCGLGIVWATGALRLEDSRSRRRATLACVAAPLLVAIGFLAATF